KAYFTAGLSVWSSDGMPGGTKPLFDLHPQRRSTDPYGLVESFTVVANRRWIVERVVSQQPPYDPSYNLWRSDGTQASTVKFSALRQFPAQPVALGSRIVYQVDNELRASDGISQSDSDVLAYFFSQTVALAPH